MLPLAVVTAIVMLVAWFPLTTLWHQQAVLNSTASQIASIRQQERSLARQAKSISSKAAATMLARQQYQLVAPGQSFIQVLPGRVKGAPNSSIGDPGFQPLVAPSSSSNLVASTKVPVHHSSLRGFVARLVRTLEFWR